MSPRCFPDASLIPDAGCFPDASQIPDARRCFPDASQMLPRSQMPRCSQDVPQMLPSVPPLPEMCPRWPQRDSDPISTFSFFMCLKMMVEIIAKCCQNGRSNGCARMRNMTRNRRIHENKMSRKPWRKRYQKWCEKGAQMEVFSMTCQVFQEYVYLRFDCAGASGSGFRAFI